MKTSNKLLIAFGIFLFIAPLLGMVVVSKVYYISHHQEDVEKEQILNIQPLKTFTKRRKAIVFSQHFSTVNLSAENGASIDLYLNDDPNYGVKIPEDLVNYIKVDVVNGVLNINIKKDAPIPDFHNRIFIVVYGPTIERLQAKNWLNLDCKVQTDSLKVDLYNCTFSVGNSYLTQGYINNNGDTLSQKIYDDKKPTSLNLTLNNSTASVSGLNLQNLTVNAEHNSSINLDGNPLQKRQSTIEYLDLHTIGKNEVSIKNFKVQKGISDFSDSTQLNIATPILKLLLKN